MAETDREAGHPIGQAVEDFQDLHVRHVGSHRYRVLSLSNGEATAYLCNVKDIGCTCPDFDYNRDLPEVCKHLAAAIYQAPARQSIEEQALRSYMDLFQEAREAVEDIKDVRDVAETAQDANAAAAVSQASDDDGEEADPAPDIDPVEGIEEWLETGFAQPEHVEIREGDHNGTAGVVLKPDNQTMSDGVYESFKGLVNALDGSTVHVGFGDDPCGTCGEQDGEFYYHVPAADVVEVVEG